MNTANSSLSTRREWLARLPAPMLAAAALGSGLSSSARAADAASAPASPSANDLGARVYNVRDFGAKGDGVVLDTAAIQAAVDACTKDGGGTVFLGSGAFLCGTVELKSNVTFHLSAGARLLGSKRREDYMEGKGVPRGNGSVVFLYAVKATNLTIEGNGTIDGQGAAFFTGTGDATSPVRPTNPDPNEPPPNRDRPHMLIFSACENLKMRDVFLTASAYHGVRILRCRHVLFDGVRIYNRVNKNNDGFHFNACEYVQITNCEIRCQDDACALFGSNKFVTVTNCVFSTRWSIFRFGGGEAQNIAISNCLIYDTYGCPIKISAGRSWIENLSFSNIVMRNVTGPIGIGFGRRPGGRDRPPGAPEPETPPPAPFLRNISFHNIRATVVEKPVNHPDIPFEVSINAGEQHSCITLNAFGDAFMENISLTDVHVKYVGGGSAELAAKRNVPEDNREYFGVWNQAPLGPPAYGLYARNVKGLTLQNIRFELENPDLRPAVVFDNVRDAAISGLSAQGNPAAESLLRFTASQDVLLTASRVLTPVAAFLQLEGEKNTGITIDGGDLTSATAPLAFRDGATDKAVKLRI